MNAGTRVALGVGAGYLLGRTKKMRLALMIAAAGATGKTGVSPGKLVQNGLKQLSSSPELGKLTDIARDELLNAAKAAAVTAASSRIESLNDRLQQGPGKRSPEKEEESAEEPEEESAEDEDQAGAENETENGGEEAEEPAEEEEPERPARRRPARARGSSSSEGEESAPKRRTRAGSGRSPVRRAGR